MSQHGSTLTGRLGPLPVGAVWFALLILASLPVFGLALAALAEAWSRPEYSHGPLIPVISLYLFLRERKLRAAHPLPPAPARTRRWPGLAIIVAALALAALGNAAQVPDIAAYALIVWIGGVVVTVLGWREGRTHWAPVLHLVFMLPLPQMLYWKLSIFLQGISSVIGVWIIQAFGVPVFLEGHIIDLGILKLQVAEACSGLRYLFPILSFTYVVSILYRGPMWHKAVLLISAAPIAVLMNAVRIGVIGVLVDLYGPGMAEGFLHAFEGWAVFGTCLLVLFALAAGLARLHDPRRSFLSALDLETAGLGRQLAGVTRLPASGALVAAVLITCAAGAAHLARPQITPAPIARETFALYPRALGEWSGRPRALDPGIAASLGADDTLAMIYEAPGMAAPVDLFSAWYRKQTDGQGLHSPEVCLPTGDWEIAALAEHRVQIPGAGAQDGVPRSFTVNRAVIQKGVVKQLVYYWFEQRGRQMTDDVAAKGLAIWDSLTIGRSDGALMRVITPLVPGEDPAQADARLTAFLARALVPMPRHVPGRIDD